MTDLQTSSHATEDTPTLSAARRDGWKVVSLLMTLVFISHFNRVSIATAGDARIMGQYGISPTRMGTVYSAFLLAYTVCMIPGGLFIDRFRPKAALIVVGFGSAVFVALTGVVGLTVREGAAAYLALLAVRGLMGVVSAPLHPASASAVGQWVGAGGRSRTNGLVNGSALVGIAATPLVFGALISRLGWPQAFLVSACATLGVAAAWSLFLAESPDGRGNDPQSFGGDVATTPPFWRPTGWGRLLTDRSLILLTLSYAAVNYFQYMFFYWMHYYFEKVLLLSESTSHAYTAVPPLAMAVGMPLGGWLSDRLERVFGARRARKVVPMVGMAAGGALLVLGVFASEPVWIVTWFALAAGAVGTAEGAFWATAVELGGRLGGSSAALLNTGGNAGGLVAPVVTPWVGQLFGWGSALGLGALVCFAGVLLWFGIEVGDPSSVDGQPQTLSPPRRYGSSDG